MEMPKPTAQHEKLGQLAGKWSGHETLHPSPWAPEKREATGRFEMRMAVDGMFLINDYEEERDGAIVFRGHGVYGYDAKRDRYTMYWFDSMGGSPNETLGVWQGDTLTFEASANGHSSRYVYELKGPNALRFSILASTDGKEWKTFMEGDFERV